MNGGLARARWRGGDGLVAVAGAYSMAGVSMAAAVSQPRAAIAGDQDWFLVKSAQMSRASLAARAPPMALADLPRFWRRWPKLAMTGLN